MMRHRSLKRELEQLRGELAKREQQLERSHADVQELRRRLAEEAGNRSADTRARLDGRSPTGAGSARRTRLAGERLNDRHPALAACSPAQLQARGNGWNGAGERRWALRRLLRDPGGAVFAASTAIHCASLELLTGDCAAAEEALRRAYDAVAGTGEKYLLASISSLLVQVVSAQGRVAEAEEIGRAAELAASDELEVLWPSLRGKALAWQERADEAERRAREAVELIRIRAALSRLTTWYSRNASREAGR